MRTRLSKIAAAILLLSSSLAFAEVKAYDVKVEGLHCAACTQAVKEALAKIPGVEKQSLEVSLKKKEATFNTSTDDKTMNAQIQKAIEDAGYTVSSINGQKISTKN